MVVPTEVIAHNNTWDLVACIIIIIIIVIIIIIRSVAWFLSRFSIKWFIIY